MEKFKNGNVKETEEEVKMKGRNRVEIFRLRQVSKKGGGLDETNYTYISARARAQSVCVKRGGGQARTKLLLPAAT